MFFSRNSSALFFPGNRREEKRSCFSGVFLVMGLPLYITKQAKEVALVTL
jgi:hypothetical protein